MRSLVFDRAPELVVANTVTPGSVFGALSCAHEPPRLSVVIPCRDRERVIGQQLEALASQRFDGPWEVIVADNGSTDGTREVAESFRDRLPGLRVVDASARRGPGHARNAGARAARGESLLFIDDDDEIQPGFLAAMAAALETHDFVASARDMEKLNRSPIQRLRANPQRDGLQRAWYAPHLPFSGGSGLAIKRALHDRVGGFDETMRYGQDNDYCFEVQLETGRSCASCPTR